VVSGHREYIERILLAKYSVENDAYGRKMKTTMTSKADTKIQARGVPISRLAKLLIPSQLR
jgi:hypothetical protein